MDISELEFDDTIEHTIVDKAGLPTDAIFILAGPGNPVRIDLDRKLTARSLRQFNKHGRASLPDDPDELRAQETERLVALTLGWRNVTRKGKELEFSPDEARSIYENRASSVRAQVSKALADIANFTQGSSSD